MEKEQARSTIYLKDLLFAALYRWKWIVAAMLVFALLLGGVKYVQDRNSVTLATVTLTPEKQEKAESLERKQAYEEEQLLKQTAYLEDSLLMELDPFAAYTVSRFYYIEPIGDFAEGSDVSSVIARWYTLLPGSGEAVANLAKEMNVEEWVIRELISVNSEVGVQVNARGRTMEEAREISAAICADIEARKDAVTEAVAEHNLSYMTFERGPMVEQALYDKQNGYVQKVTTLENRLAATKTELQRLLPTEITPSKAKPILFAAVGAVLGACLVAGIAWLGHMGSGKVYSAQTLKDHTGVQILGTVSGSKKYDRVTRWLRKLEGRTAYGETDAVSANLCHRCAQVKNLLIMGNYCREEIAPVVAALEQKGITCVLGGDPAQAAQIFETLPGCDAAVLVETCGSSRYDSVLWEMETVLDYKKELLGCVLIGG